MILKLMVTRLKLLALIVYQMIKKFMKILKISYKVKAISIINFNSYGNLW